MSVPSVTLSDAVFNQVVEFASLSQIFSVHDITRTIRSKVSKHELEIPETEVTGTSYRNDIPHTKVKALFESLWGSGKFDSSLSLSRNFNGTYFEYTPTVNSTTYAAPATTPVQVSNTVVAPTSFTTPVVVNDDNVKSNIKNYLNNSKTRNHSPTLKQIQSAIKRRNLAISGWTCKQIKDYVETDLGYKVSDSNTDVLSQLYVLV